MLYSKAFFVEDVRFNPAWIFHSNIKIKVIRSLIKYEILLTYPKGCNSRKCHFAICSCTLPDLQLHQLTAWKLPRRKSCISHSEVQSFKVLEHVGEGVQGREGHVGVLRVQVRLVQRQSQLLRHNLPPSEWNEQMNSLGQHSNRHALDHHIQI